MTIQEMSGKFKTPNGTMGVRELDTVVSGGSAEDFVADGTIARIIEESKVGYYDERVSKNAVSVIMEKCEIQDGKLVGAVTHVFVSDPTKGFGVYIDWMLNQ